MVIKNKTLDIKIILKNIKNMLKTFQISNKLLFYKTSYNIFQKLFFCTVFKSSYQIGP